MRCTKEKLKKNVLKKGSNLLWCIPDVVPQKARLASDVWFKKNGLILQCKLAERKTSCLNTGVPESGE